MKLIAVTDDQQSISDLVKTLIAIEPYIDGVILREKSKSDKELLTLIQALKEVQFDAKKITVHARPELAALEHIENVQLPGQSEPLAGLKGQFSKQSFGKSVHSLAEAESAEKAGADTVLYGHVFDTNSKFGLAPRGTDELRQITASLDIPVYAIGGIQPMHIEQLRQLNVVGIAVMSSIFHHENPMEAAKSYYDAIHRKGREDLCIKKSHSMEI